MLRERTHIYRRINIAVDVVIAGISFILAMYIRGLIDTGRFVIPTTCYNYFWLFYVIIVLWPILLNINGIYPTDRLRTLGHTAAIIIRSSFQGLFIILSILFVFKQQIVSRLIIAYFAIIVTVLLILKEAAVIYSLYTLRKAGANLRNVLIIGTIESIYDIIKTIENNSFLGLRITGLLLPSTEARKDWPHGQKVLGSLEDIDKVLRHNPIDHVIITIDRKDYKDLDNIVYHCEEQGIEIWLTASIFNVKIARLDADELFGMPIFVLRTGPRFSWALFVKGALDISGAFVFGILSLPIILIAAILIRLTSKGPIFFKQQRCSLQGRKFIFYKLRTMYEGAEKMKEQLVEQNIMRGPVFKLERDPRITPVGWFLRKFSVDEIPQFWNVLKGEMSLVGPRPLPLDEISKHKGWQRRRLSMKPGMTGLWQVSGRSEITDFDRWAELDLKYIDNWSLWLDIVIAFKTIWVVLSTRGAK